MKKTELAEKRMQYFEVTGKRTNPYAGNLIGFVYNVRADTMEQAMVLTRKMVANMYEQRVKVAAFIKVELHHVDWLEAP
ncbi:MAG: hypothetical protein WC986_14445 [Elusimicrobiota bacterium]|jgi:hypothetical protein